MNQWNNQYGPSNYGGGGYQESGWKEWLLVVGILASVIFVPWGIWKLYSIYKDLCMEYTSQMVWSWITLIAIGAFILGTIAWSIANALMRWWDKLWGGGYYYDQKAAQTSYNTGAPANNANTTTYTPPKLKTSIWGNNANKTTGLLAGERESPPRAEFFGRFSGEERGSTGPYEEKWLNTFELSHWNKRKVAKPELKAQSKDEILEDGLEMVTTTTKIDKWA